MTNHPDRPESLGANPMPGMTRAPGARPESGFFLPLIRKLMEESQTAENGATFVFTSAIPKEGVSFVTAAVAGELAALSGKKVLIAESRAIRFYVPAPQVHEPVVNEGRGVYRMGSPAAPQDIPPVQRFDILQQLKKLFPFILIDCPALSASSEALEFGQKSNGIVLIAAAGLARRNGLLRAKRLIDVSGIPILGCALNRRTYPIPDFIYKRL